MNDFNNQCTNTIRLRMAGVRKSFGPTIALAGVDLAVRAGEVHALVGENGAGKSTLMKVLSGAHQPDEGNMWLDDQVYQPRHPADGRAAGIAMIYQELSLAPHLSVMENILLGMEPTLGPFLRWGEIKNRAMAALKAVGRSDIKPETITRNLGVAQQQLVEIARSVAIGCRVLVLDEPTSSLTQHDIDNLFTLIRRLRQQGLAIVYISHFLEEIKAISDRYTVLRDGNSVGSGMTADAKVDHIIELMVGREVDELYPRSQRTPAEVVLTLDGLAGMIKPRDVSLQLRRGEVLGIAGLVGAGRTEMMRAIFGLDAVRAGQIKIGQFSGMATPHQRWQQGVGMVSENRKEEGLALNLSVADNLTMSMLRGLGPLGLITQARQASASQTWIDKIPIRCASTTQRIDHLSGGNQQKVAVARLLHADVDVLLLDEPTRGIDVGSKAQLYQLIDELAVGDPATDRKSKAILMISSYLPELMGVCDRIAVMCRGYLHPARPVDELDEHRIMLEATGAGEPA